MCGIALQFSPGRKALSLSLRRLRHRGPDGQGEWRSPDGTCWFGHTRLAILDLSANGAQPMLDEETGNVIAFNGEIYNHRALRGRLPEREGRWRGDSDTETLLAGYRRWGRALPARTKGMFAFAIYDAQQKSLMVCRDRSGMKPVYYVWRDGILSLASEVRVLLGTVAPHYSPASISAYLSTGACPEEKLLWPAIQCLPPGSTLQVTADGTLSIKRFWEVTGATRATQMDPVARVRELLEYSVEDHLQSDVPVASFLSGGVDSSIITALAAQKLSQPLLTFSVGFQQRSFDETTVAAEVAKRYRTEHHRIELDEEEAVALVREAVARLDLPSVDAINTYIVASAVAKCGVKVALTGLGGDELFGGYPVFREIGKLRWLARCPASMRPFLARLGRWGRRVAEMPDDNVATIVRWRRRFMTDSEAIAAGLPPHPLEVDDSAAQFPDDFARVSWAELTGYMRDMLLRDSDQMSMAASLELRVPFLDHELVEYLLHLPEREKLRHGGTKGLLVASCRELLPASVYQRPKMGFGLPMQHWMRGPLESFTAEGVEQVRVRQIIKPDYLARLVAGFRSGTVHWTRIWSVAVLGHYLENIRVATEADAQSSNPFAADKDCDESLRQIQFV